MKDKPQRQFTGVFIPASVWAHPGLSWIEKCLLAEMGCLNGDKGGCFASNQYLGELFGVGATRVSKMIHHLIELNLVKVVGFDGRRRMLKTLYESETALSKMPRLPCRKSQVGVGQNAKKVLKVRYKDKKERVQSTSSGALSTFGTNGVSLESFDFEAQLQELARSKTEVLR